MNRLRRRVLALLFVAIAAPLGIVLAVLTPLGQVADEGSHALRAEALSHGQIIGHREMVTDQQGRTYLAAGVDADAGVILAMRPTFQAPVTRAQVEAERAQRWVKGVSFADLTPWATYPPWFYLPAATGLIAAKGLRLGPADADLTARLVNLAVFLALGCAALLAARRGGTLLFCALTLPMSVSLGASFNPDGLIIAATALAAALLSRGGGASAAPLANRAYRAATLALALVIMDKPPYAPLAVLLLMPLRRAPGRAWAARFAALGIVALPALAWTWYGQSHVAVPIVRPLMPAGPLWPGGPGAVFDSADPALQWQVLMAEPGRFVTLPWRSLRNDTMLLEQMVGMLGWLVVRLPGWLYEVWFVAIGAALLADLLDRDEPRLAVGWLDVAGLLAAAALCLVAIYLSLYLSWTAIGDGYVRGVQGRYLIPILALLSAVVGGWRRPALAAALSVAPVAAAALGLAVLPGVLLTSYYVR